MLTIPNTLRVKALPFTLPTLTPRQKARLLKRAEQVLVNHHQMISPPGRNILHHTLQHHDQHIRFQHYPKGDRIDKKTGGQYFYHCHREDTLSEEHGHFHCFIRQYGIPSYIKPKVLPDWDKYQQNPMTHLVAIAMNRLGQPIRLFTVNRWVSEETWYSSPNMSRLLKRFKMTLPEDPHWTFLDQWIEGMLHLFAPQITWLHQARDAHMIEYARQDASDNVYENRAYEEISSISIDLASQIQWLMGHA